jgi:hypothetical protein
VATGDFPGQESKNCIFHAGKSVEVFLCSLNYPVNWTSCVLADPVLLSVPGGTQHTHIYK